MKEVIHIEITLRPSVLHAPVYHKKLNIFVERRYLDLDSQFSNDRNWVGGVNTSVLSRNLYTRVTYNCIKV